MKHVNVAALVLAFSAGLGYLAETDAFGKPWTGLLIAVTTAVSVYFKLPASTKPE